MKLQSLAIIFIIIIMPITIVLSEYIDNNITIERLELQYDSKLLNATYDAIKAYQLNTVNNSYSNIATTRVENIEAASKTLLNSLSTNFNYLGYKSEVMQEYVPAVVFTLYDGYYIYSPYTNQLTSTNDEKLISDDTDPDKINVDSNYKDQEILNGVKPYVYYSCRYVDTTIDVVITYTLDNYITVQGTIGGAYVNKSGYLINGITIYGSTKIATDADGNDIYDKYTKSGVDFSYDDTEELWEYVGNRKYKYAKINGVKYYLDEPETYSGLPKDAKIFYIEPSGTKNYSQFENNTDYKKALYNAIIKNKSAYEYYKNAYGFTKWVNDKLDGLSADKAVDSNGYPIDDFGNLEIFSNSEEYESSTSNFNRHRQAVIRYVVESNLSTSIAAFSSKAGGSNFLMPKISEVDWEKIENNVCGIAFLQQLNLGSKKYNGYAVVANTLNEEYVSENDIYIKNDTDYTYYSVNDSQLPTLTDDTTTGVWKVNFEAKKCKDDSGETYYFPMSYEVGGDLVGYSGSYTSIMGTSGLYVIGTANSSYQDMYGYINDPFRNYNLKKIFYTALGRERWGSYHVNNDLELKYFLDSYK